MSDLKQAIKQNYLKCVQDPSYFINQYCTIQHPQRGKIKFKLYPFQFDVLKEKSMYGRKYMGIERSTFIIDPDGKLIKEWRGVKVPGHVEEVYNFVCEL